MRAKYGLKRFLNMLIQRRKLVSAVLVIAVYLAYRIADSNNLLLSASPAVLKHSKSASLEDKCESFFRSLIDQDGEKWTTDFMTWDGEPIVASAQRMRLYGHCYLRHGFVPKSFELSEVESKLFPIFAKPSKDSDIMKSRKTASMFSNYGSGKGIALSFGAFQDVECRRMIATLAQLNNKLPIEVLYKGDINEVTREQTLETARNSNPPQDLRFVDVESRIEPEHYAKFERFANKWLAAVLCSFEEVMVVDADTIPFIDPIKFFEFEGYRKTGSYMFRDRAVSNEFISSSHKTLFHKMLPSSREARDFELPQLPKGKKRLEFMDEWHHSIDGGMVLLDRRKFMSGILMGLAMHLWRPCSETVFGDKEFYWIGQSVAGEEDYYIDPQLAGAVGQLRTLDKDVIESSQIRENIDKSMVCSIQSAHLNAHGELLWMNGGFFYCRYGSWVTDYTTFDHFNRDFASREALRDYYNSGIVINAAIIPPLISESTLSLWGNPKTGFHKTPDMGCSNFIWCAYDNAAAGYPGQKILFTNEQVAKINLIREAWVNSS